MRSIVAAGSMVAMTFALALAPARGQAPSTDRKAVGESVAASLRGWLDGLGAVGGRRPILAVLPPADADGRIPLFFAETSAYLEGEVVVAVRSAVKERLVVWGPGTLGGTLRDQGIDPREVKLADEAEVRRLLVRIGADAALIGRMELPDIDALREGNAPPFRLVFRGVTRDDGESVPVAEVSADQEVVAAPWDAGRLSGRFEVEFLVNGQPVKLTRHPQCNDMVENVFVADLDPRAHVNEDMAASCSFRVRNLGAPGIGLVHPRDADRLFGVVLSVDGYNAVMERQAGTGEVWQFVRRAPENSCKFVLTGPGTRMERAEKEYGYRLVAAEAEDGASWVLNGFQEGPKQARKFLLSTNASQWVAARAGDRSAVGWITVHIFAQRLPGDAPAAGGAFGVGVVDGDQVAQRTFPVQVDWYRRPVESWRIYYTIGGDGEEIARAIPIAR
ncbi:hypothetical protein [Paludisphaera sp.]|uniref:hypothetical protein n=1 Tax=Paludisphaera sp. TaxID=2017432 RepID=UPI00301E2315